MRLIHGTALGVECTKRAVLVSPILTSGNALVSTLNIGGAPEMRLAVPVRSVVKNISVILLARGRVSRCRPDIPARLPGRVPFCIRPRSTSTVEGSKFAGIVPVRRVGAVSNVSVCHAAKRRNFKRVKRVVKPMSNCILGTRNFPAICVVNSYQ